MPGAVADRIRELGLARALSGLNPRAWLCVGPGYSREDIKSFLLAEGAALRDSVVSLQQIALRVLGLPEDRVLGTLSRQEVLRILLAQRGLSERLPELRLLKRQHGFYRKLDRAMQSGRMSFAHPTEGEILSARLQDKSSGANRVRPELELLASAYEAWLEGMELLDPPLLIRKGREALEMGQGLLPEMVFRLAAHREESLEQSFWEALAKRTELIQIKELSSQGQESPTWTWERWHTLDDAAEDLADHLVANASELESQAVLIPDMPEIRRVLRRAFASRGLPLLDPRDPTRLRWDEAIKRALSPLEVIAEDFSREMVQAWLKPTPLEAKEISERGIRRGLGSYSGVKLARIHDQLTAWIVRFGGKRTIEDLAKAHSVWLTEEFSADPKLKPWIGFFENLWSELRADLDRVGVADRRAPPLLWLERLRTRLEEMAPPGESTRPARGVQLYRLAQPPLKETATVWIFGLPARWLAGEGAGDYWFSEREREVLSADFAVRSIHQVREERISILQKWTSSADQIRVLDAAYEWDGKEREGLLPVLIEMGLPPGSVSTDRGAHPRWRSGFSAERPTSPLLVQLSPLAELGRNEIRATELDRYSRCGFQALGANRWRLRDLREPEFDLWPDVRGNILHAAAKILVESRDDQGNFKCTVEHALAEAWQQIRPVGLIRGARLEAHISSRLLKVLVKFCEVERTYVERAHLRPRSLEGPELRMTWGELSVVGRPDRIDENENGVFVLDYKTSSVLPKGDDSLRLGYSLQLPFYAIAGAREAGKPAYGAQFVELNAKGGRSTGIFFKQHNGKKPGDVTNNRASKSLLDLDRDETWAKFETHIFEHAQACASGTYAAIPKMEKLDCPKCDYSDLCGKRRLLPSLEDADGG